MRRTTLLLPLALLFAGCHQHVVRVEPVTTVKILELSKAGSPPAEIIRQIDSSNTVYHMTSDDVVDLRREGVAPEVIDHMMQTERRHAERRARHYRGPDYYYAPWFSPWHGPYYPGIGIGFGW